MQILKRMKFNFYIITIHRYNVVILLITRTIRKSYTEVTKKSILQDAKLNLTVSYKEMWDQKILTYYF